MNANLLTDAELADMFEIDLEEFHRLRRYNRWPSVKLGRNVYRFTQAQVELIVDAMTVRPGAKAKGAKGAKGAKVAGQTKRSQARSA